MKMKNLFKTLLLSAVVLTAGTLVSCKDDDPNEGRYEGIPTISVSPTDLAVTLTGGTTEAVTITTEAEWTISIPSDASDITASKTSGFGNGSVTFTVPAHAERNVTVTVTATGYYNNTPLTKTATINIAQNEGGESLEGTIASITETGSYTINNAVVVGTYDSGFVMTDRSKLYFLVYMFNSQSNPDPQVPAVGSVVNVSGSVVDHNGMLQFDHTATVTPTGETQQVDLGEPAAYGYEEMKAYKSNPSYVYVKYTGTLSVNKTYYNVLFAEGTDTQGSISYPNPELNVASYNGKVVDVTGFLVGTSSSSYVNTCCTAISENTTTPSISATAPATFASAGETLNVTYTTQNLGSNQVFAEVTGEGFSAGTPANGTVAVTAAANSGADRSGSLRLYIAASEGGTALAETTVTLEQKGDVVIKYTLIDNVGDLTAGKYLMAGYSEEYKNGDNTTTFAPYSYHIWVGTASTDGPKKQDLETVNYQFENSVLTINPNLSEQDAKKGKAAEIELVAVDGKDNTYYIISDGKYLSTVNYTTNRYLQLSDVKGEWVMSNHDKGGINLTTTDGTNSIILGTAGASYNMLRSYKSPASSLVYGVCFFKAQ